MTSTTKASFTSRDLLTSAMEMANVKPFSVLPLRKEESIPEHLKGGLGSAIDYVLMEQERRKRTIGKIPNPPALDDPYLASLVRNEMYIEFEPQELGYVQNFYHLNSGGHMIHLDFNKVVPQGDKPIISWGSMSNCFNVQIQQVPTGLLYRFDTYHGPPFRYYVELSKKYPTIKIISTALDTKTQLRFCTIAIKNGESFYQNG